MPAGVCDFIIEPGTDWAVQVFWLAEQTNQPIHARGPAVMDIVSPITGQRLIRLDNGANGGIELAAGAQGIVQLSISRLATDLFRAGRYVYDLFLYATAPSDAGPINSRMRLLTGSVLVPNPITLPSGQRSAATTVLAQADLIFDVKVSDSQVHFSVDYLEPMNEGNSPETGKPTTGRMRGAGNFTVTGQVRYVNYVKTGDPEVTGPIQNQFGANITVDTVNEWMSHNAVITFTYDDQTKGLIVSKAEWAPGAGPAPHILE